VEQVNIQEAKTHLSRLLEKVSRGEEVILAKAGQPIARLVPYVAAAPARKGGQLKGLVREAPDCWTSSGDPFSESVAGALYPAGQDERAPRVAEGGTP